MRKPIQWPQESIDFLRANYATKTTSELANALGVSKATVARKISDLGLTGSVNKPRGRRKTRHARTASSGLYYGSALTQSLRDRLASIGIVAITYADALDAFAEKNIHPFIRPWQLTDKRYFEGRVVAQDGSLHYTSDSPTWRDAADKCLNSAAVILQKRIAGGWS